MDHTTSGSELSSKHVSFENTTLSGNIRSIDYDLIDYYNGIIILENDFGRFVHLSSLVLEQLGTRCHVSHLEEGVF